MSEGLFRAVATIKLVCFDLGGVLVRINHDWQSASRQAGVPIQLPETSRTGFTQYTPFVNYQAGLISEDEYAQELSELLGCAPDEAKRIHDAILIDEYPGVPELIQDLKANGFAACCLSNTNHRHWEALMDADQFPSLAHLDKALASHLIGINKPDADAFRSVEAAFPDVESILFFDDAIANVDAAIELGWEALRIDPDRNPVDQMRRRLGVHFG